jgi:hypothetical protein
MQHLKKIYSHTGTAALVILALIAVVLGYMIFRQGSSNSTAQETPSGPESIGAVPAGDANRKQDLTSDEQAILSPPKPGSPKEDFERHAQVVAKVAREAPYLDVTGCKAVPLVLRTKYKNSIKFKNTDTVKHAIVLDANHVFEIPPGTTKDVFIDFEHGAGIYGFGCDNVPHAIGMFLVTN